jgi:hypothetical protein
VLTLNFANLCVAAVNTEPRDPRNVIFPAVKAGLEISHYSSTHVVPRGQTHEGRLAELSGHRKAIPPDALLRAKHGYNYDTIYSRCRTDPGRMLCDTLRRYGCIQLEEVGSTGWRKCQITVKTIDCTPGHPVPEGGAHRYVEQFTTLWQAEPGHENVSFLGKAQPFEEDVKWICRHLWVVTNTSEKFPGGPGRPIPGTERAPKMDASALPAAIRHRLMASGEAA